MKSSLERERLSSTYNNGSPRCDIELEDVEASGPDGLRAWIVAFSNFLINFIIVGLGRMSGILYIAFMSMFHINRKTASMPFSIQQAARNFFGPLAGILGQKYGVRCVTIIGGVIGTVSAAACYFVMNITWITILWGLTFGICTAFTTTLNQVPIDQYFNRYRTTAGGFAFSGGCVAAFIFPAILEDLISLYGMARTFLVMSAFIFFVIPAALILVEPPWKNKSEIRQDKDQNKQKMQNGKKYITYNTFKKSSKKEMNVNDPKDVDFDFLKEKSDLVFQLFVIAILEVEIMHDEISGLFSNYSNTLPLVNELEEMYKSFRQPTNKKSPLTDEKNDLSKSIHVVQASVNGIPKQNSTDVAFDLQKEITSSKNLASREHETNPRWLYLSQKLKELSQSNELEVLLFFPKESHADIRKTMDMLKRLNAWKNKSDPVKIENIDRMPETSPNFIDELSEFRRRLQEQNKATQSNSFMFHLKTALKLHTNPIFLLICLCRGVFMLTFIPLVTIIVDFAMDKGLLRSSGKYVIAILSLGDLLGRLCLGWINDSGCLSLPRYMLIAMLLLAVSTATLPLMHSELSLMPGILIFGMLQGSLFIRHQSLVSTYFDNHEKAIGMGFINLLSGFIGFALPFYIGYFRDTRGSYDDMFYLNGFICALIGLMWLFEPIFVRFSPKPRYKEISENT